MTQDYAKQYTTTAASQTDAAIASGGTVKVYGIVVEGTAAGRVLVEEYNTTTLIMAISIEANTTVEIGTEWLAKNGLQITTPANVTCTVFHSTAGA
jgi:hypothetical protein